jgi:fatty acid desaturase
MTEQIKINWYRCRVDRAVMSDLMRKRNGRAFAQIIPEILLFTATGTLAYLAYLNVHRANWPWALPLLLLALFVHGTIGSFMGGIACHELCHKTPFRTAALNAFFLRLYAFLSWFDPVGYRVSHVKHHQVTVHSDHDGEVVLPQGLSWHGVRFVLMELTINPLKLYLLLRNCVAAAMGKVTSRDGFFRAEWLWRIIPESDMALRREHRNWARVLLFGHLLLAGVFIATGHWFLIILVTFGCQYCDWLQLLCAAPQHIGLSPNVSDFRLCTRTYTCGWFLGFLYWNMQYHLEHHMFPSVPFYNLPRLRSVIEHDLPPATHGLWATWRELRPIMKRQREDQGYVFIPRLPGTTAGDGMGREPLLS